MEKPRPPLPSPETGENRESQPQMEAALYVKEWTQDTTEMIDPDRLQAGRSARLSAPQHFTQFCCKQETIDLKGERTNSSLYSESLPGLAQNLSSQFMEKGQPRYKMKLTPELESEKLTELQAEQLALGDAKTKFRALTDQEQASFIASFQEANTKKQEEQRRKKKPNRLPPPPKRSTSAA